MLLNLRLPSLTSMRSCVLSAALLVGHSAHIAAAAQDNPLVAPTTQPDTAAAPAAPTPPTPVAPAAAEPAAPLVDSMSMPQPSIPLLPATAARPVLVAPIGAVESTMTVKAVPLSELPPPPADAKQVDVNIRQVDLWARIRSGFKMPDLTGPLVVDRQNWYASKPEYMVRMTERSSRYLYHIVEEIERRGMPMELALLPFVESAFNPQAMSTAKASGMWQFMPATGRDFKLTQNMWHDERRSIVDSTRAALDYFEKLHGMFGDWHLALASYNWGEGSVSRAVARNQNAGLPSDYQSLNMPNETRYYVPKLQAIKNLIQNPEANNITLPEIPNQPYFVTITKVRDIDVTTAAKMADMSVENFRALNPSFNRPVILGANRPEILLPADKVNLFLANLESSNGKPLSSWMAYTVGKTERTATIAQRFGISEDGLRAANNIPPKMRIKPGSTLLVPRTQSVQHDISAQLAQNAALIIEPDLPPTRRITHVVRKGESMASIAKRYRVSVAQLKSWNAGRSTVAAGQRVSVQVANVARGKAKRGSAIVRVNAPRSSKPAASKKRPAASNTRRK
jgi:membrane-bound lytic murein transglycosylase D